jgi:hypothetical protein
VLLVSEKEVSMKRLCDCGKESKDWADPNRNKCADCTEKEGFPWDDAPAEAFNHYCTKCGDLLPNTDGVGDGTCYACWLKTPEGRYVSTFDQGCPDTDSCEGCEGQGCCTAGFGTFVNRVDQVMRARQCSQDEAEEIVANKED